MSKLFRRVVVSVAFVPAAYVAFFIIGWFFTLVLNFLVEGPPFGFFFYHRVVIFTLLLITLSTGGCLILVTMVHVMMTNRHDAGAKGIWLLLLVVGNVVSLPLYWYLHFMGATQLVVVRTRITPTK